VEDVWNDAREEDAEVQVEDEDEDEDEAVQLRREGMTAIPSERTRDATCQLDRF
jgi:hypothetical protein